MTASVLRAAAEAPAKINLALRVLGRRPDGYHELASVMARLSLSDSLELEIGGRGEDELRSRSEFTLPPDFDSPSNLILRAVAAFRRQLGWPDAAVRVKLYKRIPLGGGLGGGSADAAAALAILNRLAPRPLQGEALAQMALSLGADLPFFLQPRPLALARGVGELLSHAPPAFEPWAGRRLILLNPGVSLSTAEVFRNLALTKGAAKNNLEPILELAAGFNDLLAPAARLSKEVAQAARLLESLGEAALWGLSGSGATFWLAGDDLPALAAELRRRRPCWWLAISSIDQREGPLPIFDRL